MKLPNLYMDQYGNKFYAHSVKELRKQIRGGGSKVHKMYDTINGADYHVGYVIGGHWLQAFTPIIKPC